MTSARFEQVTQAPEGKPTLVEGLPGIGMVAAIAVDEITDQLGLEHHGSIVSDAFPPVTTFEDGRVQDLVRVYAGTDPSVMTVQSGLPIPSNAFRPLAECVLGDLADEFGRAIFVTGAPAKGEQEIGDLAAVATTDALRDELEQVGVDRAEGEGAIGGVTGALVRACHHDDVPAAVIVAKAHPSLPDPRAAQSVIENALEPLVDFDVDTTGLAQQAERIQEQKEAIARQVRQQAQGEPAPETGPGMYR